MTRVVHLQTHLPTSGNAAYRLHEALRQAGVGSSILTLTSDLPQQEHSRHLGRKQKVTALINNILQSYLTRKAEESYGYFSYPILGTNISKMIPVREADIIYLHWAIGGFMSLENIEQLARMGKPIIVFMHDMWTITGGCHYSFDCKKFTSKCSSCQILPINKFYDLAAAAFERKLSFYAKYENLFFVSPSQWLYELAKQSTLTKHKPIFHIPNVLNTSLFKPINKLVAKELLNIAPQEKVLTFGAASIDSPYKGWKYLQEALEMLYQERNTDNITILIFGSGTKSAFEKAIPFKTIYLGKLCDDYSTALVYNASDVFIAPSLADNLPTTIMESLACGTPVVGFNTGGIPDMIQHLHNGYLSEYKSAHDLAKGITYCLDHKLRGSLLPAFDTSLLLQRHFDLYKLALSS